MQSATLANLIDTHGVEILDHLDRDMSIPILTGLQRQGDVIVIPDMSAGATTPVLATGTPVVRGENGGNTHAIVGEGDVRVDTFTPSPRSLIVAKLSVAEGATAYLAHPEHGYMGIGAGNYTISRQREQADEIRVVAD